MKTLGLLNGVGWHAIGSNGRVFYVQGVKDGILAASIRAVGTPCERAGYLTYEDYVGDHITLTMGQRVDAIDAFYQDSANRLVEVVNALEITTGRERGVPEAVLAERLRSYRQMADKAEHGK